MCKAEKGEIQNQSISTIQKVEESIFVTNNEYNIGDSRRYGIFPDEKLNYKNLDNFHKLLKSGFPVTFSKGNYLMNIDMKGFQNVSLTFEDVILAGSLIIIESDSFPSSHVNIKGNLTVLDKIFIRESNNITFENVTVKSDTLQSLTKHKNRGVSIYAGSKKVKFDNLSIENTGGSSADFYKYTGAALQVHGWNNNPEEIKIKNLKVKNVARTAVFISGSFHEIDNITIENFGFGSSTNMYGIDDTKNGQEKSFTGFWLSKCQNAAFKKIVVKNKFETKYLLKFGIGTSATPTFIESLYLDKEYKDSLIEDDVLTNVLVKRLYKIHD